MRLEYYLFALFIFALAAMLAVLIIYGFKRNRAKDDAERAKKEEKLMMMYFEVEDMIEGLKEYVELSREKIDIDIKRVETDMRALSTVKESIYALREPMPDNPIEFEEPEKVPEEKPEKREKVSQITREFTLDEADSGAREVRDIARELNRSRSEIELMLRMRRYQARARGDSRKTR